MNSNSFPPKASEPYTNGHNKTQPQPSGVLPSAPEAVHVPTTFATDLPLRGAGPFFYALSRFQLFGLPLGRSILILLLCIVVLAGLGLLPGHWVTAIFTLLLCVGLISLESYHHRRHYVTFVPASQSASDAVPLAINEKISIYATGILGVEGRYQHFSALPGFYRTFATGEHALLCLAKERSWLGLFSWPADETGMWYGFIQPSDIQALSWGIVQFGPLSLHGVAIDYALHLPPGPRRKREEIQRERLYVATAQLADARRMYVDLRQNLPTGKLLTPISQPH